MGKRSQCIIHDFCALFKRFILVLVETQVNGFRADMICLKMGFDNWFRVEAVGFSGGIWVFWNNSVGLVSFLSTHSQFIRFQVDNRGSASWYFTAIYGSPKAHLWHKIFSDTAAKCDSFCD